MISNFAFLLVIFKDIMAVKGLKDESDMEVFYVRTLPYTPSVVCLWLLTLSLPCLLRRHSEYDQLKCQF